MGVAAAELWQLLLGQFRQGIGEGGDGKGHEHLVSVEAGVAASQILGFQSLHRFNVGGGEKIDGIVAAIMALDRCIRNQGQQGSVYDERPLIVF